MESADLDKLISPNEIYIWRLFINEVSDNVETLQKILSVDEIEKAAKFHFEKYRRRFTIARGDLRKMLSYYLE